MLKAINIFIPSNPCKELAACRSNSSLEYVLRTDFRFIDLSFVSDRTPSDFVIFRLQASEGKGDMRSIFAFLSLVGGSDEVTGILAIESG